MKYKRELLYNNNMERNKDKVILVVMDGVGYSAQKEFNAVEKTQLYFRGNLNTLINASGEWVGLSKGDMGNSEVGHNTMGAGKIYKQGSALVDQNFNNGNIFNGSVWNLLINNVIKNNSTFHLVGLLSDGGVHSNIEHLKLMLKNLHVNKVKKVRLHILLDGRDVEPQSALNYINEIENYILNLNEANYLIASGGGRMKMLMDRYNADLEMVKLGYETIVNGKGKQFGSAKDAINFARSKNATIIDQDIEPFIIAKNNQPVGIVEEHDSMLLFNFRADRAIEFSEIFSGKNEKYGIPKVPEIIYAGMLEYDSDNHIPVNYLAQPPEIENTLEEFLVKKGKSTYSISETQKFGHITKYFNGNHVNKFNEELQTFVEISSLEIPFEQQPQMMAVEIKNNLINAIKSNKYDFLRCNLANGDMIGHTGNYEIVCKALEVVKKCVEEIIEVANEFEYNLIVLADHGNSEEMATLKNGKWIAKTSHTTNKVPLNIFTNKPFSLKQGEFGLANIAKTITDLMCLEGESIWEESVLQPK